MDKYTVVLSSTAVNNLDDIYAYIANKLLSSVTALIIVDTIEEAIFSLETLPHRGSIRRIGSFSDKEYRQIFVSNYTIVYRIEEDSKRIIVITIQNMKQNF